MFTISMKGVTIVLMDSTQYYIVYNFFNFYHFAIFLGFFIFSSRAGEYLTRIFSGRNNYCTIIKHMVIQMKWMLEIFRTTMHQNSVETKLKCSTGSIVVVPVFFHNLAWYGKSIFFIIFLFLRFFNVYENHSLRW